MHNFISTTLALATLIIGINANCRSEGGAQTRISTWHATTDADYTGGATDGLCNCISQIANIEKCAVGYAAPNGKSAWGYVTFCNRGKNYIEDGAICGAAGGTGYHMSAS